MKTNETMTPILMEEGYWMNTHFSIARHYGGIRMNGHEYTIVDKHGRDLFECSRLAEREGREMAIEPGEPADLIRDDFRYLYRKVGRDRFIAELKKPEFIRADAEVFKAHLQKLSEQ